jgi:Beta-lactamase enzyme family
MGRGAEAGSGAGGGCRRARRRRRLLALCIVPVAVAVATPTAVARYGGDAGDGDRGRAPATSAPRSERVLGYAPVDPFTAAVAETTLRASAAESALASRTGIVGVGIVDLDTGAAAAVGDQTPIRSASAIKVSIALAFLRSLETSGRALSHAEHALVHAMITTSDNDAATELWNASGGRVGLVDVIAAAGLTATVPDPGGAWGYTLTNGADQARLLHALVRGALLSPEHTQLLLGAMRGVVPDQRWGLAEVAPSGTTPAVKNGWHSDDDERVWRVNCLAGFDDPAGPRLAIAVTTRYPNDLGVAYGQDTCRAVGFAALAAPPPG